MSRPTLVAEPDWRPRWSAGSSVALVIGACLCIQLSAALASWLFPAVGSTGVSGLRMAVAAAVLLVLVRPRVRGRSREEWRAILAYGVAMATMNVLFFAAVERLPLGVAVTLEFLGPFTVAVLGTRARLARLLPVVALVGVVLISHPSGGGGSPVGVLFGLGAAAAFGGYTALAGRVGQTSAGFSGLALSVTVAALVLAPFSVVAAHRVDAGQWPQLAASGIIGVAVAYSLTFTAARLTSSRVVGTLLSADPAMAAVVGAVVLDQVLTAAVVAGIVLVVVSGATVTWLARRHDAGATPRRSTLLR